MKHRSHRFKYCIIYLEDKYYENINSDLEKRGYDDIEAIVPTVTILKGSTSRGKSIYKKEPILFNFGFLKMSAKKAVDRNFLRLLVKRIPGIRGFLKDTTTLHPRKKKKSRIESI